jgi:predicted phosphodiesterase
MRIRVLSDLHLEFREWNPPKADADVVVLAGDIHVGVKGIEWARRSFPAIPIVYVPGNHEFYVRRETKLMILLLENRQFRRCVSDGGWPPEVGVQTQASNRPVLLWFKRPWW